MTIADVCALPVRDIVARDCHLFLWITGPHLVLGSHLKIMEAWGFKPSAIAFVWIKLKSGRGRFCFGESDIHVGLGLTTRKNAEFCLLGRRGAPKRLASDVREVILGPIMRHSEKPIEAHRRIERYCPGPRLELFARQVAQGWAGWGDEYPLGALVEP